MSLAKRFKRNVRLAMISSFVSSLAVLFTIGEGNESARKILTIIASLIFWLGLVAEQLFIWRANRQRKTLESSIQGRKMQGLPGICSFFKTRLGMIADVVLLLSVILFIVLSGTENEVLQYIFLFFIVFAFRLHCTANGKNYGYNKYLSKRKVDKK